VCAAREFATDLAVQSRADGLTTRRLYQNDPRIDAVSSRRGLRARALMPGKRKERPTPAALHQAGGCRWGQDRVGDALTAQWLNTVGLVLGMVGVVILFIWGPPQPDFVEGVGRGLQLNTALKDGRKSPTLRRPRTLYPRTGPPRRKHRSL